MADNSSIAMNISDNEAVGMVEADDRDSQVSADDHELEADETPV